MVTARRRMPNGGGLRRVTPRAQRLVRTVKPTGTSASRRPPDAPGPWGSAGHPGLPGNIGKAVTGLRAHPAALRSRASASESAGPSARAFPGHWDLCTAPGTGPGASTLAMRSERTGTGVVAGLSVAAVVAAQGSPGLSPLLQHRSPGPQRPGDSGPADSPFPPWSACAARRFPQPGSRCARSGRPEIFSRRRENILAARPPGVRAPPSRRLSPDRREGPHRPRPPPGGRPSRQPSKGETQ